VGRVRSSKKVPVADLNGVDLFLDFRRMNLRIDERAVDGNHAKIVKEVRNISGVGMVGGPGPVTKKVTDYLSDKVLSRSDYLRDESWHDAPIIVTSNRVRGVVNILYRHQNPFVRTGTLISSHCRLHPVRMNGLLSRKSLGLCIPVRTNGVWETRIAKNHQGLISKIHTLRHRLTKTK